MRRWDDDAPPDDVDRLFARLRPAEPPPDLARRVLSALPTAPPARRATRAVDRRRLWQWAAAIAAVVLLVMSVRLGSLLQESGALGLLSSAIGDTGAFASAPGDYLATLADAIPWLDLAVAVSALVVFWVSSSALVGRATPARDRRG